jgi:hypothetical protein
LLAEVGFVTSAEPFGTIVFNRLGRFACKTGGFASVGKTFQHPRANPIMAVTLNQTHSQIRIVIESLHYNFVRIHRSLLEPLLLFFRRNELE